MDSVIEVQRQTHEEIEHLERALHTILAKPQSTHQVRLQNEHRASQLLDRLQARVVTLNNLYEDQDTRKAETDAISGSTRQDDLSAFYEKLGKITEHHTKYPDSTVGGFELELAAFVDDDEEYEDEDFEQDDRTFFLITRHSLWVDLAYLPAVALLFSGEEGYGKYLDLYANHTTYNNLKHIGKRLAYLQYLDVLLAAQSEPVHTELPKECRLHRDYELYVCLSKWVPFFC